MWKLNHIINYIIQLINPTMATKLTLNQAWVMNNYLTKYVLLSSIIFTFTFFMKELFSFINISVCITNLPTHLFKNNLIFPFKDSLDRV